MRHRVARPAPFFQLAALALLIGMTTPACTTYPKCLGECGNGRGTLLLESGDHYVGEFQDGAYHGYGTLNQATGEHYTGEWRHGLRHGQGTQVWPNGDRYTGGWKLDRRHGPGIFNKADGTGQSGRWQDGRLMDPDSERAESGRRF
ncbi:exported hypothetical protein [Nitrospina gracilis 3/211]|uniref:MORN repeat protein n=1 Tax=Nitrospina gracilis (strain 3/211) TaxID=1266370 RepID=M1YWY4_NITG3|nr:MULTISPECIES: hypothetical protein [Nitrospina]MCF8722843.1 hypothetical protein [Nitrospina sp. Nb-3]CCQ89802.1 exported hypothetical protein [Nitrospina gracilis 3/211]